MMTSEDSKTMHRSASAALIHTARPRVFKTLFILNLAEHEIYHAHNIKMPTIVGILIFISMINTTSGSLKVVWSEEDAN